MARVCERVAALRRVMHCGHRGRQRGLPHPDSQRIDVGPRVRVRVSDRLVLVLKAGLKLRMKMLLQMGLQLLHLKRALRRLPVSTGLCTGARLEKQMLELRGREWRQRNRGLRRRQQRLGDWSDWALARDRQGAKWAERPEWPAARARAESGFGHGGVRDGVEASETAGRENAREKRWMR